MCLSLQIFNKQDTKRYGRNRIQQAAATETWSMRHTHWLEGKRMVWQRKL